MQWIVFIYSCWRYFTELLLCGWDRSCVNHSGEGNLLLGDVWYSYEAGTDGTAYAKAQRQGKNMLLGEKQTDSEGEQTV